MDWGNCFLKNINKAADGSVSSMEGELNPGGSVKATKWKLTWLPALDEGQLVDLCLVDFGPLLTKRKLEEEDVFEDHVNDHSQFEVLAHGDPNMRVLKKGDILQLERKGYYIVDAEPQSPTDPLVLFTIPDGRQKK